MSLTQMHPTSELALGGFGYLIFQRDQYVCCVCASTLFFSTTLPPGQFCSALWRMRGPGKWRTLRGEASPSLSSSLGLLSVPPWLQPCSLSSFLFWGAPVNFPIFGDHPRETRQPEPFNFSNMNYDWLDLVFSPAVRCWIKMGALKISQIIMSMFRGLEEGYLAALGYQGDRPFLLSFHVLVSWV